MTELHLKDQLLKTVSAIDYICSVVFRNVFVQASDYSAGLIVSKFDNFLYLTCNISLDSVNFNLGDGITYDVMELQIKETGTIRNSVTHVLVNHSFKTACVGIYIFTKYFTNVYLC